MDNTVIVTGGAGYIGSHAADALARAGRKVVVVDNLSRGRIENIPHGVAFLKASVGDKEAMSELIRSYRVSAIMHFAGFVSVEESVRNPDLYFENNAEQSEALLEVANWEGVKHVIFSSTAAVYGTPSTNPVPEDAPLRPINPYGESKLAAEGKVRHMFSDGGRTHAILRYFNVAGVRPGGAGYALEDNPANLMRAIFAVARGKRSSFAIFGSDYPTKDCTAVRDFIHVTDLVDAHLKALEHLEGGGKSATLNCGYGHGYSVLQVLSAAEQIVGREIPHYLAPRRPGDAAEVIADPSRLKSLLNWEPKFDNLYGILKDQWDWERSQSLFDHAA